MLMVIAKFQFQGQRYKLGIYGKSIYSPLRVNRWYLMAKTMFLEPESPEVSYIKVKRQNLYFWENWRSVFRFYRKGHSIVQVLVLKAQKSLEYEFEFKKSWFRIKMKYVGNKWRSVNRCVMVSGLKLNEVRENRESESK